MEPITKPEEAYYKPQRSLLHTIAPKLDFQKYNLYFMKSNLDLTKYKLGAIVCNRLLRVCYPSERALSP